MATPLALWKFNEASSGTAPTSIIDSVGAANPIAISTYGASGAAWAAGVSGSVLKSQDNLAATVVTPTTALTNLSGSKVASLLFHGDFYTNYKTSGGGGGCGLITDGQDDFFDLQFDPTGFQLNARTSAGTVFNPIGAWPAASWVGQQHTIHATLDTNLASQRAKLWVDGFIFVTDDGAAQNTTLGWNSGTKRFYVGDFPGFASNFSDTGVAHISMYGTALTGAEILSQALRLFANNDADPNATGAQLRAASTNGGTNDVSANNTDHTISFTVTIGATNNRKVILPIAYMGVTSGITAITFNSSSTGVHLSAQQQSTFATLAGCDIYEILDADLPGAGTYTVSVTVDGAVGVACGSPVYLEGVAQSYATNTGLATGTGTSITATLGSSAAAGSILVGQLLDVSFGDASVSGVNQLRLIAQATSSVIEQVVDAKYVPSAGANSMSWTGLTNTTGKIAVVIEAATFVALVANVDPQSPEPSRRKSTRAEGWEPLGALAAAATLVTGLFSATEPPRARRAVVDGWEPVGAISGRPGDGYETSPTPSRAKAPIVDNWEPIPTLVTTTVVGWGFSSGESVTHYPPLVPDWGVLPAIAASLASASVDCQAALPRKSARVVSEGWAPLSSLPSLGALIASQLVAPSRQQRAGVSDWEPLASLGQPPLVLGPEIQSVDPRRFARVVVEAWEPVASLPVTVSLDCQSPGPRFLTRVVSNSWSPLGSLATPAASPTLVESQPPTNRRVARATVPDWQPLPGLSVAPVTDFANGSPTTPARGRTPVDNWEPLPSLPAASPSAFGYECASPVNPRAKAQQPDAWEPLPALIALPVVSSGFECSTFLPRKVRPPVVDAWQPLGGVAVATLTPSVDFSAPGPAARLRSAADGWEPIGPLGQPPLPLGPSLQHAEPRRPARVVVELWEPLASLPGVVTVECQPAAVRAPRAPVVESWNPLPGLPVALLATAFSVETSRPFVARVRAEAWEPLPGLPAPPLAVSFSSETQRTRVSFARAGDWEPLPALIPPPPVLPWIEFAAAPSRFVPVRRWQGDDGSGWLTLLIPPVEAYRSVTVTVFTPGTTPTSRLTWSSS